MPNPSSTPPNSPKISLQEGTPPLLTDTHRSLIPPLFHFRIPPNQPPSSNPHLLKPHHPTQTLHNISLRGVQCQSINRAKKRATFFPSWLVGQPAVVWEVKREKVGRAGGVWKRPRQTQDVEKGLIAFQLQNLGTRIPYQLLQPPPGIANSRFHHPGHPSYTTPSLLIRVSLRFKSFWRAGLLVAGGGEEVGGRNWGEIGGRKQGEGGRGGRGVWGGCWGVWGDLEGSRWGEDFCRGLDGVEWMSRVHPDQSSLLQNWCIINIDPFQNACFAHKCCLKYSPTPFNQHIPREHRTKNSSHNPLLNTPSPTNQYSSLTTLPTSVQLPGVLTPSLTSLTTSKSLSLPA